MNESTEYSGIRWLDPVSRVIILGVSGLFSVWPSGRFPGVSVLVEVPKVYFLTTGPLLTNRSSWPLLAVKKSHALRLPAFKKSDGGRVDRW